MKYEVKVYQPGSVEKHIIIEANSFKRAYYKAKEQAMKMNCELVSIKEVRENG